MWKRRARRAKVRWLPDTSFFDSYHRQQFNVAGGAPSLVYQGFQDLIANDGANVPEDLQPAMGALNINAGRLSPSSDTLIVDHIKGRVSWTIDGAGLSGVADGSGMFGFVIRAAIMIVGGAVGTSGAAFVPTAGGEVYSPSNLIDPGGTLNVMNAGSQTPDGVRILWRRSAAVTARAGGGYLSPGPGTDAAVPMPWAIDIKPKRILKPMERLSVAIMCQVLPFAGATDGTGFSWGQDLRVAAHNTTRRR